MCVCVSVEWSVRFHSLASFQIGRVIGVWFGADSELIRSIWDWMAKRTRSKKMA